MDIPVLMNPVADWGSLKGVGTGGEGGRRQQQPFAYAIRNGTEKVSVKTTTWKVYEPSDTSSFLV